MPKSVAKIITLCIFAALIVTSFLILKPFISAILTALVLAYIFRPIHLKLNKIIKKPTLSAFLVSLLVFIILVVLGAVILNVAAKQMINFYAYTQSTDIIAPIKAVLAKITDSSFSMQISYLLDTGLKNATSYMVNYFSSLILDLPVIIIQLIVTFFVMFYFMRDADIIGKYIRSILPFEEHTKEKFFTRFSEITSGVIYGTIIVGLIQGIVAGIGYFLFGVQGAFLLMLMSIILSVFPIGPWLIWLPTGVNLLIHGKTNEGIGLLLFGLIIVSYIDNVVRPYFVGRKAKMRGAIVLIGMLGGISLFGIIGVIVGPIILDYLLIFLEFYRTGHLKNILKS